MLRALAAANRTMPLEDFAPLVRRELAFFLASRFPLVADDVMLTLLLMFVTVSLGKLEIAFDAIAERLALLLSDTEPSPA